MKEPKVYEVSLGTVLFHDGHVESPKCNVYKCSDVDPLIESLRKQLERYEQSLDITTELLDSIEDMCENAKDELEKLIAKAEGSE